MAESATFALKAGVWFRRGLLLIVSPDSRANLARRQTETPLSVLCRFLRPALSSPDEVFGTHRCGRVRLTNNDRWLFIQMYRWFPSILLVFTIIQSLRVKRPCVEWKQSTDACLSG